MTSRVRTVGSFANANSAGPFQAAQMADVLTPNWKARVKAGELISNPMTRIEILRTLRSPVRGHKYTYAKYRSYTTPPSYSYTTSLASQTCNWSIPIYTTYDQFLNYVNGLCISKGLTPIDAVAGLVHTQLSAKLGSGMTQTLVSLAEGPKTLRMIRDAARLLRRPLDTARRVLRITRSQLLNMDRAQRAKFYDVAADVWLNARYGWRPFVYDTIAHAEAFLQNPSTRKTVRATYPLGDTTWATYSDTSTYGVKSRHLSTWTLSRSARFGQTADFRASLDLTAQQFGAYDILGTAWELVPFSFVVDWFANVGDSLQALQALLLADERVGWSTVLTELKVETNPMWITQGPVYSGPSYYIGEELAGSVYEEHVIVKDRIPVESFLPILGSRVNLDVSKVIDSIFLLRKAAGLRINP